MHFRIEVALADGEIKLVSGVVKIGVHSIASRLTSYSQ